jgi:hypothetical protein
MRPIVRLSSKTKIGIDNSTGIDLFDNLRNKRYCQIDELLIRTNCSWWASHGPKSPAEPLGASGFLQHHADRQTTVAHRWHCSPAD